MFAALLHPDDVRGASDAVAAVLAHGLRCALTGGLAIDAQLRSHGKSIVPRRLNDIDLVVEGFAAIPPALAAAFLQHHVHPNAIDGRTLLQLVDQRHALRIDLFREFGSTLSRAARLDDETGALDVVSVEDLAARTTALVCGRLRRGRSVDVKHATAFNQLIGLGRPDVAVAAWNDHRQQVPGDFEQASTEAAHLLATYPELIVVEKYATDPTPCDRCREHGGFRPAPPERIVEILGYC